MLTNNLENNVYFNVSLDKDDVGYGVKVSQMNDRKDSRMLCVVQHLDKPQTSQFVNFVRYVVFEGDLTEVYLSKNFAIQSDWH
jgi:hypothetical protein